ncbi:hypothetical protein PVL29_023236 [Vitis rotundifolia]|uniref:Uncharacterized protein n=1 Tax=Vitis rotundifolia TaxID=103349 RepID=A0AA38YNB1_VITRO|nr:hypothetical protein PVL29_023236 [Vitis rotundifolia]
MDEFGRLTQSFGLKPQGKSAPMAALRRPSTADNDGAFNFDAGSGVHSNGGSGVSQNFGGLDDYDDIFGGLNRNSNTWGGGGGGGGGSLLDHDSVFGNLNGSGANRGGSNYDGDFFGGISKVKSSGTVNYDDVFGFTDSGSKQNDQFDDFLGNSGGVEKNAPGGFDDLIPGFGGSGAAKKGTNSETSKLNQSTVGSTKSTSTLAEDPFVLFESTSTPADTSSPVFSDPLEEMSKISNSRKGSSFSSGAFDDMDLLNGFAKSMPTMSSNKSYSGKNGSSLIDEPAEQQSDLEFFFHKVAPPSSVPRHEATSAAKALAEKNRYDLQTQQEQEERHRIAESLDTKIKHWAAGKEGNLRALLSSLQFVLGPECGWQPVSLTDLITSDSVRKVYRKATLCIHPDKIQQKGADVQQKYIAEKVFDVLKEAWNKCKTEEGL